jgi:hypothetical protein
MLRNKERTFLGIFTLILVISFLHGWYFDSSKPQSGIGWADQSVYHKVTEKLATGTPLGKGDFHYQMGYSLLGSLFYHVIPSDPFMLVSFLLLMTSMILIFYGARNHFNTFFVFLFLALTFFRSGDVRLLAYAQEIFLIPWNNQVVFLCFSFFFWAFSIKDRDKELSNKLLYIASIIGGFCVSTREETLLFVAPLLFFLFFRAVGIKCLLISMLLFLLAYTPNMIIKVIVFESFFENVRPTDNGAGYIEKLTTYLSFSRLQDNLINVVFNSSYMDLPNINRKALLQASPWFWLSPLGLMFFVKKHKTFFIFFLIVSIMLFFFYLAGENVSAQKLKFHCLRYLSPSFIALSFLSVYAMSTISEYLKIHLQHRFGSYENEALRNNG